VTGVIRGAESFALGEGRDGVLFLHGWTSTPRELRFLAGKIAAAGYRCEGLLLKGHGTRLEDLAATRYGDYREQSEAAFASLAGRCRRVFVCGLSMGGLLALDISLRLPVAGLVLIAPFLRPWGRTLGVPNRWLIGRVPLPRMLPKSKGGPIADPEGRAGHLAYTAMPSASMVSVVRAARDIAAHLPRIQAPVLIFHAVADRTSDFTGSLLLLERLGSEDKTLRAFNRGNHVITLDYPRQQVESETLAWLDAHHSPESP
jgi:carboxylesterase